MTDDGRCKVQSAKCDPLSVIGHPSSVNQLPFGGETHVRNVRFKHKLGWLASAVAGVSVCGAVRASDWPQFRGPDRTGLSKETGLLKSWPAEGPRLLWKAEKCGEGHAAPSVASGRVYGMGLRGQDEVVWALDASTGKEAWSTKIADGITLSASQ